MYCALFVCDVYLIWVLICLLGWLFIICFDLSFSYNVRLVFVCIV